MILDLFLLRVSSKTLVNHWQSLSLGAKALSFHSEKECSRWGKIAKIMDHYGNNKGLVSLMVFLLPSNRKSIHIWMCQRSCMLLSPGNFFFLLLNQFYKWVTEGERNVYVCTFTFIFQKQWAVWNFFFSSWLTWGPNILHGLFKMPLVTSNKTPKLKLV